MDIIHRTPTVGECPVEGLKFLDITNDGLIVCKSPSEDLVPFIKHFRREAFCLVRSHCDWPNKTELAFVCREIGKLSNGT